MSNQEGTLYIVATPIGNLDDISARAVVVLRSVDTIYAEDTRHSGRLLQHLGIKTPLKSLHEHNEEQRVPAVIAQLQAGQNLAVISDAGTPLISDPGFRLVSACHEQGVTVTPVPGASALITALCAAGLPTDSFVYLGFPPGRSSARRQWLKQQSEESRTLVLYESRHRIVDTLTDLCEVFGEARVATVARELTKTYETIRRGSLGSLLHWIGNHAEQQKGEFVLVIAGAPVKTIEEPELRRVLGILLTELSVKSSASMAAQLTGQPRKRAYDLALSMRNEN
ncbi:MAG: 16S rRNA (cytidine(1402)-2'-O)-methyltransferase [Granulosicoccus sp.]|nr:16S rRNA (cytidine(1402)-2'-O)-methyltransferase [Granulosicoccus sp.]